MDFSAPSTVPLVPTPEPEAPPSASTPAEPQVEPAPSTLPARPEAPAFNFAESPAPKSHKKLTLIIAAVCAIALLAGGGVWAYLTYFPTPEKVIDKTFANLSSVTSVEYTGEAVIEGDTNAFVAGDAAPFAAYLPSPTGQTKPVAGKARAIITFSGASDTHQLGDPKSSFAIKFASEGLPDKNYSLGAEFRMVSKAFYASFTELPDLGFINLNTLKNQWIKVDFGALAETIGKGDQAKQLAQSATITPKQEQGLRDALKVSKIIDITGNLAAENINGEPSYHYSFAIDRAGAEQFITEARKALEAKDASSDQKSMGELYYQIDTAKYLPEGELWIGKRDYLPRQLMIKGTIPSSNKKAADATYRFTLTFKSFNQPVTVEAPASSHSIEEVLQQFLGPMMMGLLQSKDQQRDLALGGSADTDGDGLPDTLEVKLGTDPAKADTDGDGFSDGVEVQNGYNPKGAGKLSEVDAEMVAESFGVSKSTLDDARLKSRDAKRVSDIKQIQTALELYYGDHDSYPPAETPLALGQSGAETLSGAGLATVPNGTTYMGKVPTDPQPEQSYTYCSTTRANPTECANSGESYLIKFTLEGTVGSLTAGENTANPNGIVGVAPISEPVYQPPIYVLGTPKGRDDKRVSDIKQIQTALELYFGDQGRYPAGNRLTLGLGSARALSDSGFSGSTASGATVYMGVIPPNPAPGGTSYVYTSTSDGSSYSITFSLETDTDAWTAGAHTATPNGIE